MQCVGYAYARLEEKIGLSPDFSSGAGAKDIPNNAPNGKTRTAIDGTIYTIEVYKNDNGSHITANSWVSFGPGSSSYGHVIYVEEVIGDTIYYTESGTSMWKKGTAGTLKKKSKSDFINNCSSGGTYVGTVVFRGGNGGTYIEPTPTPSTPADLILSASTVNLHYPDSNSQTITVSGVGDLPSRYQFDIDNASNVSYSWGTPSSNSVALTLSAGRYSTSTTATIYLKDSSGSVLSSKRLNITVTQAPVEDNTVNLIFNYNGANENNYTMAGEKYSVITIPRYTPERDGYAFLGWHTRADSETAEYSNGEGVRMGDSDLVLYAVWEKADSYWSSWDLNVSEDELYFDNDDEEMTVLVRVDKQNAREIYFTLEFDSRLDAELGDEWYDEDGYFCRELIVYAPEGEIKNNKITVHMRDENHEIVDSKAVYVYLEEAKGVAFADRNPSGISVYLNGEKLSFDVQPQILNGRTMVPMRKIFEELGTVVGWNNNTATAIAVRKGDVVRIGIGGQYMTCNEEQKMLDSPAVVISGRTLVPVRAIAESLNCDVEWYDYGVNQVVDINMNDAVNRMENKGGLLIGYSEYPPFSFYDDNGNLIGFDTELAKYVCDFWGWDCSFVEIPFDMKFDAINSGRIDCYWNGITKTEEREELCTFTNDYVEYTYQTEEDGEWQTWHDVYSVPFRKDDYDTVQLVNIALEEAEKDGTIAYLKYKYGIE